MEGKLSPISPTQFRRDLAQPELLQASENCSELDAELYRT
jgi:hypothetical protein